MPDVKLNDTSKGILGKASEKIGHYDEYTGGGEPLEKGQKLKDNPGVKRVMQPRDEKGQFTYNSVNGKPLAYGPSRGTTVPPFLRGIELTFFEPGTKIKLEGPDGWKVKIVTIDMTEEEIVNNCRYFIESEEGFAGMGKGSSIVKKGRHSKEEKEAEPGIIGHVDPKTLSEGTQKELAEAAAKYMENNSSMPLPKNTFEKNKSKEETQNSTYKEETSSNNSGEEVASGTGSGVGNNSATGKTGTNNTASNNTAPSSVSSNEHQSTPTASVESQASQESGKESIGKKLDEAGAKEQSENKVLNQMGLDSDDKEFDVETIKKDPNSFVNSTSMKPLFKKIKNADPNLNVGAVVKAIVNGKFKNPAQLKKWIEKKYGNKNK